jgi:hypothetical protein
MAKSSKKQKPSPIVRSSRAKMPGETHQQWTSRLAQMEHAEATRSENLLTPEQELSGLYADRRVTDAEGVTVRTKCRKAQSSIARMHDRGSITAEQFQAALDIARVAEMIQHDVGFRGASIEERVSSSNRPGSAGDRNLLLIRLERLYTKWRDGLPMPRRLYVDIALTDQGAAALARKHKHDWPTARKRFIAALDRWIDLKRLVWDEIDEDAVDRCEMRLEAAA